MGLWLIHGNTTAVYCSSSLCSALPLYLYLIAVPSMLTLQCCCQRTVSPANIVRCVLDLVMVPSMPTLQWCYNLTFLPANIAECAKQMQAQFSVCDVSARWYPELGQDTPTRYLAIGWKPCNYNCYRCQMRQANVPVMNAMGGCCRQDEAWLSIQLHCTSNHTAVTPKTPWVPKLMAEPREAPQASVADEPRAGLLGGALSSSDPSHLPATTLPRGTGNPRVSELGRNSHLSSYQVPNAAQQR